jgi:hypothetical protein
MTSIFFGILNISIALFFCRLHNFPNTFIQRHRNESIKYNSHHSVRAKTNKKGSDNNTAESLSTFTISHNIWNFTTGEFLPTNQEGPYTPLWQSSPIIVDDVTTEISGSRSSNMALYNQEGFLMLHSTETTTAQISSPDSVKNRNPPIARISPIANYYSGRKEQQQHPELAPSSLMYSQWISRYVDNDNINLDNTLENGHEPFSFIYYPIMEDVDSDEQSQYVADDLSESGGYHGFNMTATQRVVGYLAAAYFWKDYLKPTTSSVLTISNKINNDHLEGLIAVLSNPCGQVVSYRIVRIYPFLFRFGFLMSSIN